MSEKEKLSSASINTNNQKRRSKWLWLILSLLIVLFFIWWFKFHESSSTSSEAQGKGKNGANKDTPVAVTLAKNKTMQIYLDALGTVTSRNSVIVKSRVNGQLEKLYFKEGQTVKRGDLLAQVDPKPYQVALAQAEGQLLKDKSLLENANIDLSRYDTLLQQDSIAKQQVDTQAALVRQYRGSINVDQAQVDNARLQLGYARITAPIDGRVGLRQVDPGNMIQSTDSNGIVTITQMQPITVLFSVPEENLPAISKRMQSGEKIPVEAFDRSGQSQLDSGELLTFDNQIDVATGSIELRANFKNSQNNLFPNQFVNVKILLNTLQDAIAIPITGLQRGSQGDFVYLLGTDNTVRVQLVKTGVVNGDWVTVLKGLNVGDQVITDGTDKLREGAKATVVQSNTQEVGKRSSKQQTASPAPQQGLKEGQRQHQGQRQGATD